MWSFFICFGVSYIVLMQFSMPFAGFLYGFTQIFLSLYGHKLPVLCMDISSDGDWLYGQKFEDLGFGFW